MFHRFTKLFIINDTNYFQCWHSIKIYGIFGNRLGKNLTDPFRNVKINTRKNHKLNFSNDFNINQIVIEFKHFKMK